MTITLTLAEEEELYAQAAQNSIYKSALPFFESWSEIPKQLGKGYIQWIEVYPELWLKIEEYQYSDDVIFQYPESEHPLQFSVLTSGICRDNFGQVGGGYTAISGGGIQPSKNIFYTKSQKIVSVDIQMPPQLLATFFPGQDGEIPPELTIFAKGEDWQTLIFPEATTAVNLVARQIINCPYEGMTKRMYLQGKVIELMALQLAPILAEHKKSQPSPRLRRETIDSIYQAREILLSRLENTPSLLDLAQTVGVSERTLRRGFQELFNTTVFGYLTNQRMEKAEKLLCSGQFPITEVAMMVGYSSSSHFTAAFKRQFGITPRECAAGKLSVWR
ncbi:helix-turn-helix transcriptional regulator [Anabaena sp. FACHB-709]|uniref:Transcriptional regulator n=2 Tax=Nostocaceae TaxID=1162 RepID=A0A1Z4KFM4_ANAVA|nr:MULTISPECIES: AraC family transcriptional regulator [Nostocaceae]BAY67796.1 transcriptional regulator [Trichormus variabilis NIES-23]HBW29548.1 AraC family transcriptional regulator [Nostoc sp. UBA8866]MBD2170111.1 helix-turn-helix transcriptional regulator [Anabaena cylindrica FACHB-318]MBD2261468.1 helix-turn-helix transcriptional regulator [Anabaena sp. FACHB-709]MBD2271052.1 helix-turn-helix transcriptional regulator [Nostoc sp. PCC 7120 = FACHB-418]